MYDGTSIQNENGEVPYCQCVRDGTSKYPCYYIIMSEKWWYRNVEGTWDTWSMKEKIWWIESKIIYRVKCWIWKLLHPEFWYR